MRRRIETLTHALERVVSGTRIKTDAGALYAHDRWFTFPEFHKSAALYRRRLKDAGLDRVSLRHLPADGRTKFGDYTMPLAWDAQDAALTVEEPGRAPRRIASYREEPLHLFNYSAPTPEGGVRAELVEAKRLAGLRRMNLKGRIVLLHDRVTRAVEHTVASRGGVGVVSDWRDFGAFGHEGIKWENYAFFPDNPFGLFGFSVSQGEGRRLSRAIARARRAGRRVTAHALVRTRLYPDTHDLVVGTLRGATDEEVIGFGHLYEYGAWDNAAGAAVLLEVARALKRLIAEGALPAPRRTLKFVTGFEVYALAAYLDAHRRPERLIAGLNVDGVGVDYCALKAPISLFRNPDAAPAYTDFLAAQVLETVLPASVHLDPTFRARSQGGPFALGEFLLSWKGVPFGGCDGLPADPCFNVPWPGFVQFNKRIWHNSLDKPDVLVPAVCARFAVAAGAYLYWIASAGWDEVQGLARAHATWSEQVLRQATLRGGDRAAALVQGRKRVPRAAQRTLAQACAQLRYECNIEAAKVDSLARLVDAGHKRDFEVLRQQVRGRFMLLQNTGMYEMRARARDACRAHGVRGTIDRCYQEPSATEVRAMGLVPRRLVPGLLTLESLPDEARYTCPWGPGYQVLANRIMWTDGKRSIWDIHRRLRHETGASDIQDLVDSFLFLEKYGYVAIDRRRVPTVTKDRIVRVLERLGVRRGDTVLVHSSLSALGYVRGGPDTVIRALRAAVGRRGTLALPTFAYSAPHRFAPWDKDTSPAQTGIIPEFFRLRGDTLRSEHPTHSVSALGPAARRIVADHEGLAPFSEQGPFGKLLDLDAKLIFLGCSLGTNSSLHAMEDWLGMSYLAPEVAQVRRTDGSTERRVIPDLPVGHRGFYRDTEDRPSKITRKLRERGLLRERRLGAGRVVAMDLRRLKQVCFELLPDQPDLLLCDREECRFCAQHRKTARAIKA